ncbi:hypothetical protein SAMN05428945_1007 [Streptomyces sp. 2224.1]|uniref:hypothetical protein n=1 Tax=Streptomyces sp. 2224.1 TaxID=1881020 RepID=UPI00089A2749|nr:hypothetical protein [Streptomyces sp. 2224.1]SEB73341.1 hypothetical protein SAMN05428945_1007 [Streptomyces sp. 2224.1]
MGIESDQLVYDYLSRVGDLAQQRGLPSATRMRLVTGLRAEIDGQQADSVSGVKRILARLGTPEAVVAAAGSTDDRAPGASWGGPEAGRGPQPRQEPVAGSAPGAGPSVPLGPMPPAAPSWPAGTPRPWSAARHKLTGLARRGGLTGKPPANGKDAPHGTDGTDGPYGAVPAPRAGAPRAAPSVGLPPHLAGADELGDDGDAPDWWRVEPAPFGPGETVPGFVGGIEIPEIWDRPESDRVSMKKDGAGGAGEQDAEEDADGAAPAERPLRRMVRRVLDRRRGGGPGAAPAAGAGEDVVVVPARAPLSPVLTLAVLLLVAGAALGSWLALAGGWGLAYVSRRLSRAEAKFAALGVPGTVVGGLVVWLWGRFDGRWGEPIAQGRLGQEMVDGLPGVVRVAAVASALFLVWRMRRAPR